MSEPCKQEGVIGGLEATQEAILNTLKEMKQDQNRLVSVLEIIAAQGTTIKKHDGDIEGLYARIRRVELNAVEHGVKITMAAGFISLVITTIAGFVLKHWGK